MDPDAPEVPDETPYCKVCTVDGAYALALTEYERIGAILNSGNPPRFIEGEGRYGESLMLRTEAVEALIEFTADILKVYADKTQSKW